MLLLAGTVAACGDSDDSSDAVKSPGARTSITRPSDAASAYVGLTQAAAIARAEADKRPWRIGREDDEQFMLTQEFVDDRVTFELDDGKVTKATLG
jgi:hypothetical protein